MERSNPITVRAGGEADAAAVVGIWNDSFVFSGTGGRDQPYTSHDYLQLGSVADLMVAEILGEVRGTITLLDPSRAVGSIAADDELEITRLAVAPAGRRRGIGRLLLAWAQGEAVRRGARALALWTRPSQTEAHHLYRSAGFRRSAARDGTDADSEPRLVYALALRQSGRTLAARRSRA